MGDPIKTFPRAYWYCKTVVSYPGSAVTGAKMKHQRIIPALLLLLVAASPMLVNGVKNAITHDFDHPTSLPTQASDKARDALADRGTHGHTETGENEHDDNESAIGAAHEHQETGVHEDNESSTGAAHENQGSGETGTTDVDNAHSVNPGVNVTIIHCLDNSVVDLTIGIIVVPAEGANVTITHTVTPPSGHMFTPLTSAVEPTC